MGILDEAIREHLELKRKQGAEQEELRQLEDEAFGPATRPDQGEPTPESQAPASEHQPETARAGDSPEAAPVHEPVQAGDAERIDREAIAQQPTEVFDVASELAREVKEEDAKATEAGSPKASTTDEEPAPEVEAGEPEAEAVDAPPVRIEEPPPPPSEPEPPVQSDEDSGGEVAENDVPASSSADASPTEVFDEESLSEELDRALDAPADEERTPAFFEETDEFHTPQRPRRQPADPSDTSEEDVLEETPDFLEETPEHDRLWFEQKPPKDFDFND